MVDGGAETDTNKMPSFIVEKKKRHFFRQCKWAADLGRSAIISGEVHEFIFSPCSMNAHAGYSGKINIQICITGRRQGECAPRSRFVRPADLFLSPGTQRPSSVRGTLISRIYYGPPVPNAPSRVSVDVIIWACVKGANSIGLFFKEPNARRAENFIRERELLNILLLKRYISLKKFHFRDKTILCDVQG